MDRGKKEGGRRRKWGNKEGGGERDKKDGN